MTVLNNADSVKLGSLTVNKIMLGVLQVWSSAFTPISLFANGENGAWYEVDKPNEIFTRRNLLTYTSISAGVTAMTSRTAVTDATISWLGIFKYGVAFGDNSSVRYAYITSNQNIANVVYTFSVFVKMDDGLAPIFGSYASEFDGALVIGGQIATSVTTVDMGGGIYRLSATRSNTASHSANGVAKYKGNSSRSFVITGYQLEFGETPTAYQDIPNSWDNAYMTGALSLGKEITCFQDYACTIPVSAPEQPVGAMLDRRLGLIRGPELVDTANLAAAWTPRLTNTVVQDGDAIHVVINDASASDGAFCNLSALGVLNSNLVLDHWYEITCQAKTAINNNVYVQVLNFVGGNPVVLINSREYTQVRFIVRKGTLNNTLTFAAMALGEEIWIKNISVKELPGNHLIQATATARGTLTAKWNLLNNTIASAFSGVSGVNTATYTVGPTGLLDGIALKENAAVSSDHYYSLPGITSSNGATQSYSIVAKARERSWIKINSSDGASWLSGYFDLASGVAGSKSAGVTTTIQPHPSGNGWYICTVTRLSASTGGSMTVNIVNGDGIDNYDGVTGYGIDVAYPQVEHGAVRTAYQECRSVSEYNAVGFPHRIRGDGVDDLLQSGPGITTGIGFYAIAASRVLSLTGNVLIGDIFGVIDTSSNGIGFRASGGVVRQIGATTKVAVGSLYSCAAAGGNVAFDVGTPFLMDAWHTGTTIGAWTNKTPIEQTVTADTLGLTDSSGNYVRLLLNDAISEFYGGVYLTRPPTLAERSQVRAYLGVVIGVAI